MIRRSDRVVPTETDAVHYRQMHMIQVELLRPVLVAVPGHGMGYVAPFGIVEFRYVWNRRGVLQLIAQERPDVTVLFLCWIRVDASGIRNLTHRVFVGGDFFAFAGLDKTPGIEATALYSDGNHSCQVVRIADWQEVAARAPVHHDPGNDRVMRSDAQRVPRVDCDGFSRVIHDIEDANLEGRIGLKKIGDHCLGKFLLGLEVVVERWL